MGHGRVDSDQRAEGAAVDRVSGPLGQLILAGYHDFSAAPYTNVFQCIYHPPSCKLPGQESPWRAIVIWRGLLVSSSSRAWSPFQGEGSAPGGTVPLPLGLSG